MARPQIRASDVVFMYVPEPTQYDLYSGTVTGWAGRARSLQERDVQSFRTQVSEAQKRKMRYCGSVDFLVDYAGFIDFRPQDFMDAVCRDLDGSPLRVPWLHDHSYRGHPAYWFCSNNPHYRAYLRDQVQRACAAPIDGLHIDDYRGTFACASWNGGCFCEHCMRLFRDYLKRNRKMPLPTAQAEEFDYSRYLHERGVTAQKYRSQAREVPLRDLFLAFQQEQMMALVRETFEMAERLRGKPLLRSVNSGAHSAEAVVIEPLIDYFCGEVDHHASNGSLSPEPIFVYALVEALGKRQTATASGWDWAWIAANNKPGMVQAWVAQAYAFGSVFMVPHNQWCYTPEKGTHWWKGKPEDFAFLYRFVREHISLFDDHYPLTNTVLRFTDRAFERAKRVAVALVNANMPFAVQYVTNQRQHTAQGVGGRGSVVVTPPDSGEIDAQRLRDILNLPPNAERQIRLETGGQFVASLRSRLTRGQYPVVCHLLNRAYDRDKDSVTPTDVTVYLLRSLVPMRPAPKSVELFVPGGKMQTVPLQQREEHLVFEVKRAGLWTVAALV